MIKRNILKKYNVIVFNAHAIAAVVIACFPLQALFSESCHIKLLSLAHTEILFVQSTFY